MFTLLPSESRKTLATEYRQRYIVVLLAAVCIFLVIAGILFLPSYLLSKVQAKDSQLKKEALKNSTLFAEEGTLLKNLQGIGNEVTLAKIVEPAPSDVIIKVGQYKPAGVSLNHFSYVYSQSGSTLSISGVADDRQTLINFNDSLKKEKEFQSVDFPISNLSSGKNIVFTISIKGNF